VTTHKGRSLGPPSFFAGKLFQNLNEIEKNVRLSARKDNSSYPLIIQNWTRALWVIIVGCIPINCGKKNYLLDAV
jgi:hypothetical protein